MSEDNLEGPIVRMRGLFFFCILFVFGFLQFLQMHKNYVTNSMCIKYILHYRVTQLKIHYTTLRDKRNDIKKGGIA